MILDKIYLFFFPQWKLWFSHDSEEKPLDNLTKSHVIYEWMIKWLTQDVLVSLLDESAFLNESLIWFKNTYILIAPFRHLWRNNVIDKSSFEVSNYFQKVIFFHRYHTHQSLYLNYKLLSQYFCDLNVCNRNNDTVWLKRLWGCFELFRQCERKFKCSNHTGVIIHCTDEQRTLHGSKVEEWNRQIIVI